MPVGIVVVTGREEGRRSRQGNGATRAVDPRPDPRRGSPPPSGRGVPTEGSTGGPPPLREPVPPAAARGDPPRPAQWGRSSSRGRRAVQPNPATRRDPRAGTAGLATGQRRHEGERRDPTRAARCASPPACPIADGCRGARRARPSAGRDAPTTPHLPGQEAAPTASARSPPCAPRVEGARRSTPAPSRECRESAGPTPGEREVEAPSGPGEGPPSANRLATRRDSRSEAIAPERNWSPPLRCDGATKPGDRSSTPRKDRNTNDNERRSRWESGIPGRKGDSRYKTKPRQAQQGHSRPLAGLLCGGMWHTPGARSAQTKKNGEVGAKENLATHEARTGFPHTAVTMESRLYSGMIL